MQYLKIAYHERAVGVLERGVGREDGVVGLDNGRRELRRWVDAELELRLFAVVGAQALKEERTEPGTGSATEGVEYKESLEPLAVVGQAADLVHHAINELLSDGVVATRICRKS